MNMREHAGPWRARPARRGAAQRPNIAAVALCTMLLLGLALAGTSAGFSAAEVTRDNKGLTVRYCPSGQEWASASSHGRARTAEASHQGWPPEECAKLDKGPPGVSHTLIGLKSFHNHLLGGYGNDTIWGGNRGDVIWGDYQPSGQSASEVDHLHGGAGPDWIYASHGFNEIWTGAGNDQLALVYGHGVVHCNGGGLKTFVMRYLPQNRPWQLIGCNHKVIDRYRA